jgi:hypothetical protein
MWRAVGTEDFKQASEHMLQLYPGQRGEPLRWWWVCDDYELRSDKIVAVARWRSQDASRWTRYKPLEETPNLFLKFASLHEAPNFEEAALQFSRRYGLLNARDPLEDVQQEDILLSEFQYEAKLAWVALTSYEAAVHKGAGAAESLYLEYSNEVPVFEGLYKHTNLLSDMYSDFEGYPQEAKWRDFAVRVATTLVLQVVWKHCYLDLVLEPELVPESGEWEFPAEPSDIKSAVGFENLLGAMYLQMYWLIASGEDVARCEYCRQIISLARPHPEGRKRRRDKRFCNDACRQAHHRSKSKS